MSGAREGAPLRTIVAALSLLLVVLVPVACTSKPKRSNTGFTGTWGRTNTFGRFQSTIAIVQQGERYLLRWKLDSDDGTWSVRCGWDGVCQERLDGKHVADYRFEVTRAPGNDFLNVSCRRIPLEEGKEGFHYMDDLVLEPDGLKMTSYTRVQNDRTYPREATQVRIFDKVSDGVADPPAAGPS